MSVPSASSLSRDLDEDTCRSKRNFRCGTCRQPHIDRRRLSGMGDAASVSNAGPLSPGAATEAQSIVPVIEREHEQLKLSGLLAQARAGRGGMLILEGVAGIGKTTLLEGLRARAPAAGFQVLWARGAELELGFAYGVVRQFFERLLRAAPVDERLALLDGSGGLVGQLLGLPGEASAPPGSDFLFGVLNGLYWLTVNLADRNPVLLVLDDAQWSDGSSLAWLSFLRARPDELQVAVVIAARPEDQRPELAQLVPNDRELLLRPAPLTPDGCAMLTRDALGEDVPREFCDACRGATGGNPFLLRELLAGLIADGVAPSARTASVDPGVPIGHRGPVDRGPAVGVRRRRARARHRGLGPGDRGSDRTRGRARGIGDAVGGRGRGPARRRGDPPTGAPTHVRARDRCRDGSRHAAVKSAWVVAPTGGRDPRRGEGRRRADRRAYAGHRPGRGRRA